MFDKDLFLSLCEKYDVELSKTAMSPMLKDGDQAHAVVRASVDTGEYLPQDKQAWDEAYARYCRVTKC